MQLRNISIAGKVMLSGEYAVLVGGTAVLIPVPRYLKAIEMDIVPEKPYSPIVQMALKHPIPEIAKFEREHGRSHVFIDPKDFLIINDLGFPLKLGLGLSAAEAVAIVGLRFERAGRPIEKNQADIIKHALIIHKQAQRGLGSGADVVSCAYGKPLKFSLHKKKPKFDVIPITNPANLMPLTLVWTGQSANTRELVGCFENWLIQKKSDTKKLIGDLIYTSNRVADAWFVSSKAEVFAFLDDFNEVMNTCARAAGLPYRIPLHEELEIWAKKNGGRAKPTGAGGGDMVLLAGDLPIHELSYLCIPIDTSAFITKDSANEVTNQMAY
jgi:phosphomevalonate kinase